MKNSRIILIYLCQPYPSVPYNHRIKGELVKVISYIRYLDSMNKYEKYF